MYFYDKFVENVFFTQICDVQRQVMWGAITDYASNVCYIER